MAKPGATPTSYAVLGLLAVRPWTTYELARQAERSLRWFFPRAERAVYLEAKRLVELGWAEATTTATGRRPSTVYRITGAGRGALRGWLAGPSAPPSISSEAALKVFFADQAGWDELRGSVALLGEQAAAALAGLAAMAGGEQRFPERMPTNVLSMRLMSDLYQTMADWAAWAHGAVDVLAAGDPPAVARQTQETLRTIAARGADPRD